MTNMRNRRAPAILLVLTAACGGQTRDARLHLEDSHGREQPMATIARAEDHRDFGAGLAALADHPAMEIRARLANALGRIGDLAAADVLAGLADDTEQPVREAALFAIGLLGEQATDRARGSVLGRLEAGPDVRERLAAFDAAGRLAGADDARRIAAGLADPLPAVRAAAARALGFLGQRQVAVADDMVEVLARLLGDDDRQVRLMAAFALFRVAVPLPGPAAAVEALGRAAGKDEWWEVRAYALRALARRGGLDAAALERALADDVTAVGATAVSALGLVDDSRRCTLAGMALGLVAERVDSGEVALVGDELAHTARASLEAVAACDSTSATTADAARIASAIENGLVRPRSAGASLVLCLARLVSGVDELALVACDPDRPHRGKVLLARRLGEAHGSPAALRTLTAMLADPDLRVALAALESLAGSDLPEAPGRLVAALEDERMLVVSGALGGIAAHPQRFLSGEGEAREPSAGLIEALERTVERFWPFEHAEAVLVSAASALGALGHPRCGSVLATLAADPRPGVRKAVLDAYGAIEGLDPPLVLPPTAGRRPVDPRVVERWSAVAGLARIETTRGVFLAKLRGDVAPATVESFAGLAAEGFFDGTEIHRVVPNFVVQAGDPTATGMGDPGYSLRCEVSALPYRRGVVGMALSGKDTGGSQFFVALSSQPHLDGNYTVFGEVIEGMEVLDLIEEGDTLLDVRVESRKRGRLTPR